MQAGQGRREYVRIRVRPPINEEYDLWEIGGAPSNSEIAEEGKKFGAVTTQCCSRLGETRRET